MEFKDVALFIWVLTEWWVDSGSSPSTQCDTESWWRPQRVSTDNPDNFHAGKEVGETNKDDDDDDDDDEDDDKTRNDR